MSIPRIRALEQLISLSLWLLACKSITNIPNSTVVPQPRPDQSQIISYVDLFQHPQCSLPCWNGIQVEKTSYSDAKEVLEKRYGVENVENSGEENLEWKAYGIDGVNAGYISFSENTAAEILVIFNIDSGPTVEDLITVLDEPTWVFVSSQPNDVCRRFDIIYPTLGLYGHVNISEGQKDIQPSSQIMILRFLQTKLSENMQVNDGYLVRWEGYKKYCEN